MGWSEPRAAEMLLWGTVSLAMAGCRSLSNLDIHYESCVSPKKPYLESFNDGYQVLLDRCWSAENADERSQVSIGDNHDLSVRYATASPLPQPWTGKPPGLVRRVEGDFVIVAQAESLKADGSFCGMDPGDDAAGMIVRPAAVEGGARASAAFLLRPYLEDPSGPTRTCEDGSPAPPKAIAEVKTNDPSALLSSSGGIGEDGEGEIAICRLGSLLHFFYRVRSNPDAGTLEDWKPVSAPGTDGGMADAGNEANESVAVGTEPVDVALAVTASTVGVQGTFNWVAVLSEGTTASFSDCQSPLQEFNVPLE